MRSSVQENLRAVVLEGSLATDFELDFDFDSLGHSNTNISK